MGVIRFFTAAALAVVLAASGWVHAANPNTVRVAVVSKIDQDLGVYWINSWQKGILVRQKEEAISARGMLNVDSYFGHSFLVIDEEHAGEYTHYTKDMWDPKIMTMFTMGEFDIEAIVTRDMNEDLVVTLESALTRTAALMEAASQTCRESPEVKRALVRRKGLAAAAGASCPAESDEMPAEFMECLTKSIAGDLAKKESEANKSMRMLEQVGDRARNYTCADPKMETSNTSLKETVWVDPIGGKSYNSEVFLDEPSAKIHLLDNFASAEECKLLMDKATPHLQDATVNAGAGKSTLSSARRAKAGGVTPDLNDSASKLTGLYRRGYEYANHVTGYDMQLPGQEGFSVIKYGNTDEYRPHCDGDCTGVEYIPGGRVATMVIYCEQAKSGGGTTFSSSDVFINGKKGQAVFFSYLGPDGRTDVGRTRHSGCPIIKGTKWIATLWMRLGVTDARGWQYYDPSGMPSAMARERSKRQEEQSSEGQDAGEQGGHADADTTVAAACDDANEGSCAAATGTVATSVAGGAVAAAASATNTVEGSAAAAQVQEGGIMESITGSLTSLWGGAKS